MAISDDTPPNTVYPQSFEPQHCRDIESSWFASSDVILARTDTFHCSNL